MNSNLLGPHTKFDPNYFKKNLEEDIIYNLSQKNQILIPFFDGNLIRFDFNNSNISLNENILKEYQDLKNGILIPYDLVEIPKEDLFLDEKHKSYKRFSNDSQTKFISKPDFFYIKIEKENAHLYPIDIKESCQNGNGKQISQYNTATLYFHSNYLRNIVSELKKRLNLNIIFENGFYLSQNKNINANNKLEDYIKQNLKNKISHNLPQFEYAGIKIENSNVSLIINDLIFDSDLDYTFNEISESEMIFNFNHLKKRFSPIHLYPINLISICGFNGGNKPIIRLDYSPSSHIITQNPKIEELENQILRISALNQKDLLKFASNIEKSADENQLETLYLKQELETKKLKNLIRNGSNLKARNYSKTFERKQNKFAKELEKKTNYIEEIQNEIQKLQKEIQIKREEKYFKKKTQQNTNPEKIREDLITKLNNYRNPLIKKRKIWQKEDLDNNERIYQFNSNCLQENSFSLNNNPHFKTPLELYLQFKEDVMQVNLFQQFIIDNKNS